MNKSEEKKKEGEMKREEIKKKKIKTTHVAHYFAHLHVELFAFFFSFASFLDVEDAHFFNINTAADRHQDWICFTILIDHSIFILLRFSVPLCPFADRVHDRDGTQIERKKIQKIESTLYYIRCCCFFFIVSLLGYFVDVEYM